MNTVQSFFELNQPIIRFGYALCFFILGMAIAFLSQRSSRLELARSLAWLAAFGITYSLYEWGELFSPVQEAYLSENGIILLHSLHLTFLCASFALLMEFGVSLLRPLGRGQWLRPLTFGMLIAYIVGVLIILPRIFVDTFVWHNTAEAIARYAFGFPGGMLSAYALREQSYRLIAPLEAPHIVGNLRKAGIALALFAIFGGLIPPRVPFFPGSVLNEDTFTRLIGIPPLVFQALIGLAMTLAMIRALEIFEVETERHIEAMEQQQILMAERERIARELHDGAIQTVYTAGLLVESAQKMTEPGSTLSNRLERAILVLNDAIGDLRRNLTSLKTVSTGRPLTADLQRIADDPRFRSLVQIQLDMDLPEEERLSPHRKDHVLAVVGEAMANIIRHAHARFVQISAKDEGDHLQLVIRDDGSGFSRSAVPGYGLRNMRDRARLLGGTLDIQTDSGRGTTITLRVPWKDER